MKSVLLLAVALGCASAQAPKCGQTPIKPKLDHCDQHKQTKIVGGCEAIPYSWPWQIGFAENYFGSLSLICGGSVIDNQWIMTAGHCVYGHTNNPSRFRVKLGISDWHSMHEPGEDVAEIEKIYLHPDFNHKTVEWDIALLKLKKSFNYTNHIQPVCLPKSDQGIIVANDTCWVTGWGTLHEGDSGLPRKLHQVLVPYLDQSVCDKEYGADQINNKCMFCAGRTGEDSCQGDSGGPLVTQSKDGAWHQYGIVSWGSGCAEKGYAGVYSRVTAYCDFIEKTTGKAMCM